MKNTKRDSSRSPASGEQLTFVDRHSSRHGQARRRSSRPAGRSFHASFVWCVSSCFSCSLYNKKVVFRFGLVLLLLANVLVCLEREESMRMKGCSSWRQVRRGCMFSAGRSVFWCPLMGAESDSCGRNGRWKVIPAGEMAGGRVSFSDTTGYMSKIRVQFCGKVAPAGCTQSVFRLGRVKTSVDQSTQLISRWMKMGTLLCRQMTRVHPVVSFTHKKILNKLQIIGAKHNRLLAFFQLYIHC